MSAKPEAPLHAERAQRFEAKAGSLSQSSAALKVQVETFLHEVRAA